MQTEVEIMNPYTCKSTRINSEKGTIFSKCLRNIQTNQNSNDNRDYRDNFCDSVFKGEACCTTIEKDEWICCLYCLYCRFNHLSCHANIVQRVKSCYKIKINSGESKSCFYGFSQHKSHPCQPSKTQNALKAPLLQSKSCAVATQ